MAPKMPESCKGPDSVEKHYSVLYWIVRDTSDEKIANMKRMELQVGVDVETSGDTSVKQKVKVTILTNTKSVVACDELLVFEIAKQAAPIRLEPVQKQKQKRSTPTPSPKKPAKIARK